MEQPKNQYCLSLAQIYALFKRFIELYIPNTLHAKFASRGQSLPYLKCSFHVTETLLRYHDYELHAHLKSHQVIFEMFATHWVMTVFARNCSSLAVVYELWEIFLFERDRYFIFYVAVALLKLARSKILAAQSIDRILTIIDETCIIADFTSLSNVYYEAVTIRSNTPYSFAMWMSKLGLFQRVTTIVSNEELEWIESCAHQTDHVMPMFIKEVMVGALDL